MNNELGTGNIRKLVFKLAIPTVIAQLINIMYSMVDRIYIGHIENIGTVALTGIGITLPIIIIISSFASLIASGGAPKASIKLGENDIKGANKILGNSFILLIIISILLTTIIYFTKEELLMFFGASAQTLPYALEYLDIYLLGTISVQLALGLNQFISAQGKTKVAMISVLIGAIINIILDPIFIFTFGLGVKGAAYATIIAQSVSAIWIIVFLISKKSIMNIKKENFKLDKALCLSIIGLGLSPFVMQITEAAIQIVFNTQLLAYGNDMYIASMTILISCMQMVMMPASAFGMGVQSLISYNYGAKKIDRVRQTFRIMLITEALFCLSMFFIMQFFSPIIAAIFTDDPILINLASKNMKMFFLGAWPMGMQMACQMTFLSLGQAKISLFLAVLRKIILLIPLAYILPMFLQVNGIFYAEAIADIIASFTTMTLFILNFNKILTNRVNEQN
ncbi:MAG: MATE family efflux transporter [Erysipelotrichaceae bacterium]